MLAGFTGTTRLRPLLDVFIDPGCTLACEAVRALAAKPVDVLREPARLDGGGVLLLGARTLDGAQSLAALKELRSRNPHVLVYLCVPWDSDATGKLAEYTRAGLDRLHTIGSDNDVLVRAVSQRVLAPPPEAALRSLSELALGVRIRRFALHAFRNSQLPEPLGMSRTASTGASGASKIRCTVRNPSCRLRLTCFGAGGTCISRNSDGWECEAQPNVRCAWDLTPKRICGNGFGGFAKLLTRIGA